MPSKLRCPVCRKSKKACLRNGQEWRGQEPQTKCDYCQKRNLCCGPKELPKQNEMEEPEEGLEMGEGAGMAGTQGFRSLAPVPNGLVYTEAGLETRLYELSNSEIFHIARQSNSLGPDLKIYIVPEQLRRALEVIEELADQAQLANHRSNAEVAYNRLIEWYRALGPEVTEPRQRLLMKVGGLYEDRGLGDEAERCYLEIFEDLPIDPSDNNTLFHHAIRNFHTKGRVSQEALLHTIRCCPPCRFKLRNAEYQTPLHLAVSTATEEVAVAILVRLKNCHRQSRIDSLHLDARDCRGQTILSTAVLAQCSLPLINALIVHGSEVNPEILMDGRYTPLQAASRPGSERIDIASLLLRHRANPNHVDPYSTIAQLMVEDRLPEVEDIPLIPKLDQPRADA